MQCQLQGEYPVCPISSADGKDSWPHSLGVVTLSVRWAQGILIPNFSGNEWAVTLTCCSSLTNVRRSGASVWSYTVSTCAFRRCRWFSLSFLPSRTRDGSIESIKASSESALASSAYLYWSYAESAVAIGRFHGWHVWGALPPWCVACTIRTSLGFHGEALVIWMRSHVSSSSEVVGTRVVNKSFVPAARKGICKSSLTLTDRGRACWSKVLSHNEIP